MIKDNQKKSLSLYIHIPFCVRKCLYCDFLSMPATEKIKKEYTKKLCSEIEKIAPAYQNYQVKTLFIGGGTPTALQIEDLQLIVESLQTHFEFTEQAECSTECNPGTIDRNGLERLRSIGLNRISFGLQSAQNNELKSLGRIHTWEDFVNTYQDARKAGFENINVDLMAALPGQSLLSYEDTLHKVMALSPEHISAYSLIIEEGTPFYDKYHIMDEKRRRTGEKAGMLPSEDEEREMYYLTREILTRSGFHQYEISNYAKNGFECRHNEVYWRRENYLGIGLGAASMVENIRWSEESDFKTFMQQGNKKVDMVSLSMKDQMEEYMFLGLRMTRGISAVDFEKIFKYSYEEIYGKITRNLEKEGLVKRSNEFICLTKKGMDVSNRVFVDFLLNE